MIILAAIKLSKVVAMAIASGAVAIFAVCCLVRR